MSFHFSPSLSSNKFRYDILNSIAVNTHAYVGLAGFLFVAFINFLGAFQTNIPMTVHTRPRFFPSKSSNHPVKFSDTSCTPSYNYKLSNRPVLYGTHNVEFSSCMSRS